MFQDWRNRTPSTEHKRKLKLKKDEALERCKEGEAGVSVGYSALGFIKEAMQMKTGPTILMYSTCKTPL